MEHNVACDPGVVQGRTLPQSLWFSVSICVKRGGCIQWSSSLFPSYNACLPSFFPSSILLHLRHYRLFRKRWEAGMNDAMLLFFSTGAVSTRLLPFPAPCMPCPQTTHAVTTLPLCSHSPSLGLNFLLPLKRHILPVGKLGNELKS